MGGLSKHVACNVSLFLTLFKSFSSAGAEPAGHIDNVYNLEGQITQKTQRAISSQTGEN